MYLRDVEGPVPFGVSGSSSIGVIGGGGVPGGEGDARGLPRRGEESTGAEVERLERGLRDRCERRERVEPPAGLAGEPIPP